MGKKTMVVAVLLGFIIMQNACSNGNHGSTNKNAPGPESPGGKIYSKYCVACHGVDGKLGLSGAANLSISVLTKPEVNELVTNGRRLMAPFKDKMTPQEIDTVSEYVLSLRK